METPALKALEAVGIHGPVAQVYLCLLERTKMSISDVARVTGIKRPTCYEYIDSLLSGGFAIRVPVGKRMYYAAEPPEKLEKALSERIAAFQTGIESMRTMHSKATNVPRVTFHGGKSEIRSIYEDIFRTIGETRSIFPPAPFFENFTVADYDSYDKDISGHAIKSKDLFVHDPRYKHLQEIRGRNGGEGKYSKQLPEWFTCNVDTIIYADTVALISLRDLSAVVIRNKDIAELFRSMHDFIWKNL